MLLFGCRKKKSDTTQPLSQKVPVCVFLYSRLSAVKGALVSRPARWSNNRLTISRGSVPGNLRKNASGLVIMPLGYLIISNFIQTLSQPFNLERRLKHKSV